MLRNLIQAAAILALVTGPAAAQGVALSPFKREERKLTPDELKAQQEREKDYKAAMDKIPEKKVARIPGATSARRRKTPRRRARRRISQYVT